MNNNKIFTLLLLVIVVLGCSKNYYNKLSDHRKEKIVNELITDVLEERAAVYEKHKAMPSFHYIDSTLKFRPYLNLFGKRYSFPIKFTLPPEISTDLDTSKWGVLKFTLAEELKEKFAIRPSSIDSARIEIDTVNVIYMSPLIPTAQKDTYFLHEYIVYNENYGNDYYRKFIAQNFYVYVIKRKRVERIK